jgi:hypothetical protein
MKWDKRGTFVLWEVATGKIIRNFAISVKGAHEAAFDRGGKQVVVVDHGGRMRRFVAATGKQLWSVVLSEHGGPEPVAFSQDAGFALIVTKGYAHGLGGLEADIWDAVKGEILHTVLPLR